MWVVRWLVLVVAVVVVREYSFGWCCGGRCDRCDNGNGGLVVVVKLVIVSVALLVVVLVVVIVMTAVSGVAIVIIGSCDCGKDGPCNGSFPW